MSRDRKKDNFYLILGTDRNADLKDIKKAYRSCCKKYHPDSGEASGGSDKFNQVQEAYETLSDSGRREAYNRSLEKESVPVRHSFGENLQARNVRSRKNYTDDFFNAPGSFFNFDSYINSFINNFMNSFPEYECELILSDIEAARGGVYSITLPHEAGGHDLQLFLQPGIPPGSRKEIRIKTGSYNDIKVVINVVIVQ